jgi:hypothetical protein
VDQAGKDSQMGDILNPAQAELAAQAVKSFTRGLVPFGSFALIFF